MSDHKASLSLTSNSRCAVVIAHPDDETLWPGGTILSHPEAQWTIVTLCRKSDPDRAPRFYEACKRYGAEGHMADLDDGPEQKPLSRTEVQDAILRLLPSDRYDLILTHGLWGEYTRHMRHEEVSRAVLTLRKSGSLHAPQVLRFAYEDGNGEYAPRPFMNADISVRLPQDIWLEKYRIIREIYGFAEDSWEAKTTPRREAFWSFGDI